MHASRSSVRVTAACSVHSTTSWWFVAAGCGRNATPRSGARCAVSTSPDEVGQRQRVGQVVREPGEHRRRLGHGRARLEQVAQDERHAEAVAEHRPAAERERDRQAVLVDAVEQAPQAVARAHHALPVPRRVPDERPRAAPARSRSSGRGAGRPARGRRPASSRSGTAAGSPSRACARPRRRRRPARPAAPRSAPARACARGACATSARSSSGPHRRRGGTSPGRWATAPRRRRATPRPADPPARREM